MSLLKTFLGIGASSAGAPSNAGETATVRRISAALERLGTEQARFLAAFAYVLARVAHADLQIDSREIQAMHDTLERAGGLTNDEATLVCEIACEQSEKLGGTENYVVTREFRAISTKAQRAQLLECLFAVAASDRHISTAESAETLAIAEELGFTRPEAIAIRSRFREYLAELKA